MNRPRETALFIVVTLLLSWSIGWLWVHHPQRGWLTQWLMVTPAVVGLSLSWLLRREPPRAIGLTFTGPLPWLVAFVYPFVVLFGAVALSYAVRAVTGNAGFIYFQPAAVSTGGWLGFRQRPGLSLVGLRLLHQLWYMLPWLLVAVAYRQRWPERLAERLPASLRALHHGLRWALFGLVVWSYPGPLAPPGTIGEEVGWRGTLVRRYVDRPLLAFAITAPLWAAFHLPVIFAQAQVGHLGQNIFFLGAVAAAATPIAVLYLWSRSVWPCVILHFTWNFWNPFLLGDVYGGRPGLFGGAIWAFNGEGLFGLLIQGAVSLGLGYSYWRLKGRSADPHGSELLPGTATRY